ncbi:flagellar export chaperone FliS [Clostridium butyricum]|uniref:flagellar export chaperone FliS n=1 Tax=Clostridium butyricum TaxID=1492 RepID=UPI0013D8770A|nr:flagellar export chaperone FliS [Clostridium butyricum]MCQ2022257.1 flagellar export chaperone FliS [Clostridium butyricum]NFB70122.1 flagellar export chaperone FliS [Clostridium butyricum]NFB89909.1 flagellar export chaperone FliS [Clostridium butyricum]
MYSNGYNVYKSNSVNYASKDQMLLMLVDGAVKFTKIGRQAILDKDIQKSHNSLIRVQDIFTELIVTLDTEKATWMKPLKDIYIFIKEKLIEANMSKNIETLDEVLPLIEEVRDLWNEAYKKAKQ